MKINAEQFDALAAKIDAYVPAIGGIVTRTRSTEQRLAAIEQGQREFLEYQGEMHAKYVCENQFLERVEKGQGALLEALDAILARLNSPLQVNAVTKESILESIEREIRMDKAIGEIRGALLGSDGKMGMKEENAVLLSDIANQCSEIRGALLLQQFKGGRRCPAKSRTKKRK